MSQFTIKQIFIDNWNNFVLDCNDMEIREQLRKWNLSIELSFGYDPTICDCGGHFIFFELKVPTKLLPNVY